MIMVDANILLYAEDSSSPHHKTAVFWWDAQLSGTTPVGLCWPVLNAFLRISTNPRIFERPLKVAEGIARVNSWLEQPCTKILQPTENHWEIFQRMLAKGQAMANLVPDAHLAAIAISYGCNFYSTDSDFSRFPKLKWKNPLE